MGLNHPHYLLTILEQSSTTDCSHYTSNLSVGGGPIDQPTDDEQVDASPCRPAPPDLQDALTRLTQTVERMANKQNRTQANPAATDAPEDPDFNWTALQSPLEVPSPLPPTGVVQRIAAGLFAKVQTNLGP